MSSERTAGPKARYARPRLAPAQGNYQIAYLPFVCVEVEGKVTEIHLQSWTDPQSSWKLRLTRFVDKRRVKVTRLSALRTG